MTHAERMAALVEAATELFKGYKPPFGIEYHLHYNRIVDTEGCELIDDGSAGGEYGGMDCEWMERFRDVFNGVSGPSIALAAEGMRLLALYRAATKQRAEDLVAIEERLDALLERWEGKE